MGPIGSEIFVGLCQEAYFWGRFFRGGCPSPQVLGVFFSGGLREISWDFVGFSNAALKASHPLSCLPWCASKKNERFWWPRGVIGWFVNNSEGFCASVADLEGALQQSNGF